MNSKKYLSIVCLIIIIFIFIFIFYKNKKYEEDIIDNIVNDKFDIDSIDNSLGSNIEISQDYLMDYIVKKSGIWYRSNGTISDIKKDNNKYIFKISNGNKKEYIIGYYDNKNDYKVNDKINFIFTIDLSNNSLKLLKISKDNINYNSVIDMSFDELFNHINKLNKTYFIVSGYLVTTKENYYLYKNKDMYEKNNKDHFIIYWDGSPLYTGNANVKLICKINNLYSLKDCNVLDK